MYEKIRNDPYILEIYRKVDQPIKGEEAWAYHGLAHVLNVVETVEEVLRELEYDEEYIENAKIAAMLHDLGTIEGKDGHASRSYGMAKNYLDDNKIVLKYKDEVLDAIRAHSDVDGFGSAMTAVLVFADKTDIKKTRLAPGGYKVEGLRQYQYINDIDIKKDGNSLTVKFVVDGESDKEELESWYFTAKAHKAIRSFADYFGYDLEVLWNDSPWKFG